MPLLKEARDNGGYVSEGDEDGYPGYWHTSWSSDYLHFGGRDAHGDIPPVFWDAVEVVMGEKLDDEWRPKYFSCGC